MSSPDASVCAVVVGHEPDRDRLRGVLTRVRGQVDHTIVVDNGPGETAREVAADLGVTVLRQPTNIGLAAAVNRGIEWAREHGCSHVLLLDQDSWPAPGMVAVLADALSTVSEEERVAAVGSCQLDPRLGELAPFVEVGFPISHKLRCTAGAVRCDFIIGSGSLVPLAVLDDVGGMDEGLFIDNVDLDWCFRARAHGYAVYGVGGARMEHLLGDRRVPLFGGRLRIVQHSPSRLYFIMRNRVALYRRRHTPRVWVAQDVPRILVKLVIFGVLIGPRRANLRHMLSGLWDGVRRVAGPGPLVVSRDPRPERAAELRARVVA
jgi:rhamnosyltransferase